MTDEQASADASANPNQNQVSPGRMLREGRERHNLTLEQVADRLHLRQQVVSDLEQDQYSKYVSSTFTRGYLRAYARLVEIDDEAVLAAYDDLGLVDKPQQMKSFSRRTRQQSNDNKLMLVTYIVGALIIGSAVVFWLQNSRTSNGDVATQNDQNVAERLVDAQDEQVAIEPLATAQSRVDQVRQPIFIDTGDASGVDGAVETGSVNVDAQADAQVGSQSGAPSVASNDGVLSEASNNASGAGADQSETDAAVQAGSQQNGAGQPTTAQSNGAQANVEQGDVVESGVVQSGGAESNVAESNAAESNAVTNQAATELPDAPLVLVFSGDAWIRIEDATGEAIAFGVKPDGHVSALDGQPPYDIAIGAPENVALYYEGEPIDLSSYRPGRLARITIPQPE